MKLAWKLDVIKLFQTKEKKAKKRLLSAKYHLTEPKFQQIGQDKIIMYLLFFCPSPCASDDSDDRNSSKLIHGTGL